MRRGSSRARARATRSAQWFARSLLVLSTIGGYACAKAPAAHPASAPQTPASATPEVAAPATVLGFKGHIKLDPRAGYNNNEGEVWQYLFYQDGTLYDAMLCYPHANRCELVELKQDEQPQHWTGTLSESQPGIRPFAVHYELPVDRNWTGTDRLALRLEKPGVGEMGSTTLTSIKEPSPPIAVVERLRGEQRLRALYAQITQRYAELSEGTRVFPESHSAFPAEPPCRPMLVSDPAPVSWLGLSAPAVLSWSFEVQADAAQGTVRVIARRNTDCKGEIETLTLSAKADAMGGFAREPIASFTSPTDPK
jgi:hypothetical protein